MIALPSHALSSLPAEAQRSRKEWYMVQFNFISYCTCNGTPNASEPAEKWHL